MKTPEQVAVERVAKAAEEMARALKEMGKAIEKQNAIVAQALSSFAVRYRDVEEDRPEKAPKGIVE